MLTYLFAFGNITGTHYGILHEPPFIEYKGVYILLHIKKSQSRFHLISSYSPCHAHTASVWQFYIPILFLDFRQSLLHYIHPGGCR